MEKKYTVDNVETLNDGTVMYHIRALRDIPAHGVCARDIGGLVQSENNLSQEGNCWIAKDAMAMGRATVAGDAVIDDYTTVAGDAVIDGCSEIHGNNFIGGTAHLTNVIVGEINDDVHMNIIVAGTLVDVSIIDVWINDDINLTGDGMTVIPSISVGGRLD